MPEAAIGIVVPVLNEDAILDRALSHLACVARGIPVVVVDGGSTDTSLDVARRYFTTRASGEPNRGVQMNLGAASLATEALLFLHADSRLPEGFEKPIGRVLRDPRVVGGCFRLRFDVAHPMLRFYAWCTRFPGRFLHFGDQAFFVRREVFLRMGGFRNLPFLEDVDFLRRLRRYGRFQILPEQVLTSARRFLRRGIVRQQLTNIMVVTLFELGCSPGKLIRFYPPVR